MHTENGTIYPFTKVSQLVSGNYAFLGANNDNYFFVCRGYDGELYLKWIEEIDDSTVSDRMREDFDDYEARKDAVRDGDTEESFDDWRQDIDIRDYKDSCDYYDCPQEAVDILYEMELWSSQYADHDGYYLDTYDTSRVEKAALERYYHNINVNDNFNSALWADLTKGFHINELEFLNAEDIR